MALYRHRGVSVESWVEMDSGVPMRYEVDQLNERATLYFGDGDEYVLSLCRDGLAQMASLAGSALSELDSAEPPHSGT